jgi:hypothetical protein
MTVVKRICVEEHTITDTKGTSFTIEKGKEYTTSKNVKDDGTVTVFSRYWVRVPISIFAGEKSL